ncbi:class I SAM-dependent methyltransferase [bacterium]|nr:class I SAM-dependent methyltransferase [bacterium]
MTFPSPFADVYEGIFPRDAAVERFLLSLVREPGSRILDAGCGTGLYCNALAQKGHDALGIDLDPAMIDYAKTHYPDARFKVMDLMNIGDLPGEFYMVYSTGNVLAYLNGIDLLKFLPVAWKKLMPGGIWFFQVMNWDYILALKEYVFPERHEREKGLAFFRSYTRITEEKVLFRTRLVRQDRILFESETKMFPFRSKDLIRFHEKTGFRLVSQYAGYDRIPYDAGRDSANLFVFRKRVEGSHE